MTQQLPALAQAYPITDEIGHQCLEIIRTNLTHLSRWSQTLPTDETIWTWISKSDVFHTSISWLSGIATGFDVLLLLTSERNLHDDPLLPMLLALEESARRAIIGLQNHVQGQEQPQLSVESSFQQLSPLVILSTLLAMASSIIANPDVPPTFSEWPAVIYHPYYTARLLYELVESLERIERQSVCISLRRVSYGFEMAMTVWNLHLTPLLWERLLAGRRFAHSADRLEVLREMGGEIEPLTWNEGQGEGVIVRLPWAKTAEERDNGD